MSRLKLLGLTTACAAALWMVACDSDEAEPNPTFMTGDAGAPQEPTGTSGKGGVGGMASHDGGAPAQAGGAPLQAEGGGNQAGAPPEAQAGAGGAPQPEPPYDCVLHPKTHLEIINACTAAQRIEKHPSLPALPE